MTSAQLAVVEQLTDEYHVVLVDPTEPIGAILLTPARFCEQCGGDGIDPSSYELPEVEECSPCNGRGGVPVIYPPRVVLPNGEVQ